MRQPLPAEEKKDDALEEDETGVTEPKKDRAGV
jgi:hypothetical protein